MRLYFYVDSGKYESGRLKDYLDEAGSVFLHIKIQQRCRIISSQKQQLMIYSYQRDGCNAFQEEN